ncbi:tetratricopeptide repeat protein [Nitrospira sp. NS4]|uniref:tetratricopeptide repeat protein n=1 Tax=Nitrospira sp. NS4 TaxID=3414498 RepID=UPI003C2AAE36
MALDRSKVLHSAQSLATRGQYDAAIAEWKKLAMEVPNDGSVHNSIGDLHLKRNSVAEAVTAFLQAAAAFRSEGATLKAIATYKKVLKVDPTRYDVYRHLGDLNAERGLLSSAIQDYLTVGKYYLKERKGKEALEIYKKIVSQDPSNLDAQQRVAELCLQENLQDEATKVYLQLGRERSAQGRYDEAKDAYLAVLRIDPKNSEAVQFVESPATGSLPSQQVESSGRPVTPALKSMEPLDLLAEATRRMDQKQYAGAEAILNQLLTREPGNPQVCQLLARLHLLRGDIQVALGEYRFLAGAALRAQDYPLAEALITEFLAAEPNSVPLLELYAELHEERGAAGAAAEQYAKAVELLLAHPEPGMESLHEELFDKVKALAPGSDLVARLAARMGGPATGESAVTGPAADGSLTAGVVSQEGDAVQANGYKLVGDESASQQGAAMPGAASDEFVCSLVAADSEEVGAVQGMPAPSFDHLTPPPDHFECEPLSVASGVASDGVQVAEISVAAVVPPVEEIPTIPAAEPVIIAVASDVVSVSPQSVPDYEAHYTLGVAYRNMGLYDDALAEFQMSKASDSFYLDSCLMTAVCMKDQRQYRQAIRGLEAVLSDPRCQGAKGQAIRYELGMLYETESLWEQAAQTYETIPSFHDVPKRLESLRGKYCPTPTEFRFAS